MQASQRDRVIDGRRERKGEDSVDVEGRSAAVEEDGASRGRESWRARIGRRGCSRPVTGVVAWRVASQPFSIPPHLSFCDVGARREGVVSVQKQQQQRQQDQHFSYFAFRPSIHACSLLSLSLFPPHSSILGAIHAHPQRRRGASGAWRVQEPRGEGHDGIP